MHHLHDDVDRVLVRQPRSAAAYQSAEAAWESDKEEQGSSVISDHLFGQTETTLTCSGCSRKSVQYERLIELSVRVGSGRLESILQEEFATEEVTHACQCDHDRAQRQMKILRFPTYLVIHLKRFFYNVQRNFSGKIDR